MGRGVPPQNQMDLKPGDMREMISMNQEIYMLPDIDKRDVKQVEQRIKEYFDIFARYDAKPTVSGMAMALGMNRKTLYAIAHDAPTGSDGYRSALPREVTHVIKKAYSLMELMWESYMNGGKINPVSGIFLAKNNYDYQDKQEVVVQPIQKQDTDFDADEIRERYIGAAKNQVIEMKEDSEN